MHKSDKLGDRKAMLTYQWPAQKLVEVFHSTPKNAIAIRSKLQHTGP
jgi:hypothetical protein